jgi:PHD/YefM family antitoxin component YafN of YafNO toxin-antitoxin module
MEINKKNVTRFAQHQRSILVIETGVLDRIEYTKKGVRVVIILYKEKYKRLRETIDEQCAT